MMPSKRIQAGGRWILFVEYLFYWAAFTALTIATGYYLWSDEDKDRNQVWACNNEYDSSDCSKNTNICNQDDYVDVQERFGNILRIYFALFVTYWATTTFILLGALANVPTIAKLAECLSCLTCCLGIAALVILHVYRFQPSGRSASGDCLTKD